MRKKWSFIASWSSWLYSILCHSVGCLALKKVWSPWALGPWAPNLGRAAVSVRIGKPRIDIYVSMKKPYIQSPSGIDRFVTSIFRSGSFYCSLPDVGLLHADIYLYPRLSNSERLIRTGRYESEFPFRTALLGCDKVFSQSLRNGFVIIILVDHIYCFAISLVC